MTDKTDLEDSTKLDLLDDNVNVVPMSSSAANELLDFADVPLSDAINAALDYFNLEEKDAFVVIRISKG